MPENVRTSGPAAADLVAGLAGDGFARLSGQDFAVDTGGAAFRDFRAGWEDLVLDGALVDGGSYRYRRYGRLAAVPSGAGFELTPLPHRTFRQDGIPMWRSNDRLFAPIEPAFLDDRCLREIITTDLSLAAQVRSSPEWTVGLHMIRIVAVAGEPGLPTPEGRHRDGHSFVGMHLVRRENSAGGESAIYRDGLPDVQFTLRDPLESVLVDDTAIWHEASPISILDPAGGRTVRDMLLVDVNPA
ncbi:2OG-Fe dioxygenase family protein [Lentzea sp. NPDC102401]|uniref:2OG-Fe dioxygenase family protein n=1 Tax=Lentzea sp. NPDC102401 TaxID=3364128 RepID=UPI00381BA621